MAILSCAAPGQAQQQPSQPAPAASSAGQPQPTFQSSGAKNQDSAQNSVNNDRLFGVLPNYATVENEHEFGPLTAKAKFKLSADSMFDPVTFPFIGFEALIGQAQNSEPSYGQGFKGYAKRYGTSYADAGIGTTMTTSVFPTLLRQDPRYFQLGRGSIWHRMVYSVSRIFITRSDSGNHQFNASELVGNAVAAGISNAYHPKDDRSLSNTLSVWGTDIMWDTAGNVAKEFWPDVKRHFWHKKTD
ncbi:MAG TPA: hypothetical protein VJO53_06595 [Candidatus Acidoferrales bacterium]|nr:hypothetical protein [Candidatus Acidoferrales bacterium]